MRANIVVHEPTILKACSARQVRDEESGAFTIGLPLDGRYFFDGTESTLIERVQTRGTVVRRRRTSCVGRAKAPSHAFHVPLLLDA